MTEYTLIDVITPWLTLFALALAVGYAEDWIHHHFFGIGFLATNGDKMRATVLFYIFFAPGILVHEVVQYLVAGALSVPIKTVFAWPDEQKDGTMRLDFVVIKRNETDRVRAMLFAAAPFLVMGVMVWYISTEILDLHAFTASLGSGDFETIISTFQELTLTPNFYLWFYLLFVIANTMLPNQADAEGLPLIFGAMVAISALMLVFGLGNVLLDTLGGSVADTIGLVNIALASILVIDIMAIIALNVLESLMARWRGFRMDYRSGEVRSKTRSARAGREIGSDEPYPAGEPLPTIYNLQLPLPEPIAKPARTRPASTRRTETESPQPALTQPSSSRTTIEGQSQPSFFRAKPTEEQTASARPSFGQRTQPEGENKPSSFIRSKPEGDTPTETPARTSFGQRTQPEGENRPSSFIRSKPEGDTPTETSTRPSFGQQTQPEGENKPSFLRSKPEGDTPTETPARPSFGQRTQPEGENKPSFLRSKPEGDTPTETPARPSFGQRTQPEGENKPSFLRSKPEGDTPTETPARPSFGQRTQPEGENRPIRPQTGEDEPSSRPSFSFRTKPESENAPPDEKPARPTGSLLRRDQTPPTRENPFRPAPKPATGPLRQESKGEEDDFSQDVYEEDDFSQE